MQGQLRTSNDGKTWFHHKMIIPILQHQYISSLSPENSMALLKDMISNNRLFIESSQFDDELFSSVFRKVDSAEEISDYLKSIFELIFSKLENNTEKAIEREFIYSIYKTINRLEDILGGKEKGIEPATWFKLLKKLLEFQTVPFEGEPLGGLQIMGILETRALDFENLIILNLNEGTFPRTSPPNSFIPYTLRKGFDLPTIEYQDNIFSYYFFRLINRAKKVSLLYTTAGQGMHSGEMSRFLYL
jgi:inactivated superfamily I helicase